MLFAGESTPTRAAETVEACREWAAVDKTSIVELETFVRRHPTSTEAEYAKARIESVRTADCVIGSEKRCLKPKDTFKDCPDCPEMVVMPAGSFTMGAPANEPERTGGAEQVQVSIPAPFAVGKYAVTFDERDACVADPTSRPRQANDSGRRYATEPVRADHQSQDCQSAWYNRPVS